MKKMLLFLAVALFAVACKTEDKSAILRQEISDLETQVGEDPGNAKDKITSLLGKYEEFAAIESVEAKSKIDYLLRAGEMASLINQHNMSIGYYDQILNTYPDDPKAATALFMKGYTLDDKLGKLEEAKAIYEAFLNQYPENDFADDTQFLLKNLGKSEEEIIKQFEAAQQDTIQH